MGFFEEKKRKSCNNTIKKKESQIGNIYHSVQLSRLLPAGETRPTCCAAARGALSPPRSRTWCFYPFVYAAKCKVQNVVASVWRPDMLVKTLKVKKTSSLNFSQAFINGGEFLSHLQIWVHRCVNIHK